MNRCAVIVVIFAFIVSCCDIVDSKRIAGTLLSQSNWEFLTRFCFLTYNGVLDYEFSYPVVYGTQEILLYYDEPGQWDFVYKTGKTCTERLSVLSTGGNQIMALNTSDAEVSRYSGCQLVRRGGATWYKCQGQRSFRSSRERWWYMAVARCQDSRGQKSGLYLEFKIHMTNGDDLLHKEFSADEFYILPVDVCFFLVYLAMSLLSIVCAAVLRNKNLFHTTYKMYLVALFIWTLHLLLMVIAWGSYGSTGLQHASVEVTGRIMQATSTAIFTLMLILMGKGYTITRGRLTRSSSIKMAVFFLLYIVVIVVLFIWEGKFFDPGKVLYYYESPPGYGMIAMHFIAWLWFLYATAFTIKNTKNKLAFYIPFLAFYTLWFLTGPVVTLIAMFVMAKWSREKTVNGVEQFVTFLGHIFFLALTRPSAANVNFPYHVRTTQISSLPSDKDDGNPYVVSTGVVLSGPGPNLELFTTSKPDRQVAGNTDGRVYYPLGPGVSRAQASPPPSYPQAVNGGLSVPSASGWSVQGDQFLHGDEHSIRSCVGGIGFPALDPTAPPEEHVCSSTTGSTPRHPTPLHPTPLPGYKDVFQVDSN